MKGSNKILLIEDDEDDFLLTKSLLSDAFGGNFKLKWISDWGDAKEALNQFDFDVCLVDHHLGERSGLDLVREAIRLGNQPPFIILTGMENFELDLQASEVGVADYLVKGRLDAPLLERAIRYAKERHFHEERLTKLSRHDVLTGLANRSYFAAQLNEGISQADRIGRSLAILLLDLDHFKNVNDVHGHLVGDALLVEVSNRLKKCVRETDTVARLGGDEFAVLATNLDNAHGAEVLAGKIISALSDPYDIQGLSIQSGASVGISMYSHGDKNSDLLLKQADMALYRAKDICRGTVQFHESEMNAKLQMQKELASDLAKAINSDELRVHFQPVVDPMSGSVIGVEALLRWEHPERGLILPVEFLEVAENSGLVHPIGAWLIQQVCQHIREWNEMSLPKIFVSINISLVQLRKGDLYEVIRGSVFDSDVNLNCLELEFSEDTITGHNDIVTAELLRLKTLGVKLVLDNFGMGAISLVDQKSLPFDRVKINHKWNREGDSDDSIVGALIGLGKAFEMDVIVKGIESSDLSTVLHDFGCSGTQGFHYCRPLAPKPFLDWWRRKIDHDSVKGNTGSVAAST